MRSSEGVTPVEKVPVKIIHSATAVMDKLGIYKNRYGNQSKLQTALGRLKPHLQDDEVVLVIKASMLRSSMQAEQFKQEYQATWERDSREISRVANEASQQAITARYAKPAPPSKVDASRMLAEMRSRIDSINRGV